MSDTPATASAELALERSEGPTPTAPSALQELEAWRDRHGVDFLIVAVSPWGKTTPIAFLLPDGFGAEVQVVRQVENGLQP